MQNTSELFQTILKNPLCVVQNKVTIAGKDYFDDTIESLSTSGSMFSSAGPCIGSSVSRTIEVTLKTDGASIPRAAEIDVFIRLVLLNSTGAVKSASEWIPKGVFYIDTREPDDEDVFLKINGYDAMLKGEQAFLDQSSGETGIWPQSMSAVASACAGKMGVEIDNRTVVSSDYSIGYPTDYTCRELLQHIAAAHGGNWTITDEGKLRLIVLGDLDSYNPIQLGRNVSDFSAPPAFSPFTKLTLWVDDETGFASGNDTGRSIEGDCPWATQEMCDAVLSIINGYQYVPYTATDALIDPAAEIGDSVVVNGKFSVIASMDATLDPLYTATISAPADEEIDHEFPYQTKSNRTFNRKLAKTKSEIMVALDSISTRVSDAEDNISELEQTAGQVKVSVTDNAGTLSTTINAKVWEALRKNLEGETTSGFYFDFALGRFVYDGTGVFRSEDGSAYIEVESDGLTLYANSGSGSVIKKLHIGFTSSDGVDYPYIQLGAGGTDSDAGLIKKFANGVFVGNGAAREDSGDFSPKASYAGIFINTFSGKTYVVNGTSMMNIYTGDAIARFG